MRTPLTAGRILLLTSALVGLAAGCGSDRVTGPGPQSPAWNEVRFQESSGGGQRDLTIRPDGDLSLVDGGNAVSTRGLLAGEKLETLARLVAALPPHSYSPQPPCSPDGFVVSVVQDGEVRTYSSGSCDPDMPAAIPALWDEFRALTSEVRAPRAQVVPHQVLLEGVHSAIRGSSQVIIRDRDALIRLLVQHHPEGPVAIPSVDFRSQMVIGEFLGEQPGGTAVTVVEGVERTESGWLRTHIERFDPTSDCAPGGAQPFVLVAVPAQDGNLLFETESVAVNCR